MRQFMVGCLLLNNLSLHAISDRYLESSKLHFSQILVKSMELLVKLVIKVNWSIT